MKKHLAIALTTVVAAGGAYAAVASASSSHANTTLVTVTMTDYHFKLSPATGFKKGVAYKFVVVNKGNAIHNFDIQRVKASKLITHGKTTSFLVTFTKAGKYPYLCDVPRHAELGMAGNLVVK